MRKDSISAILEDIGPCLTSELIEALKKTGISDTAARQRITRAQGDNIRRLSGIRFAKNARFIYLSHQFGTKAYWDGLERAFLRSGKAYWAAIVTLRARGGICPKSLFPTVSGAPIFRTGQLSPTCILERLTAIHLLNETFDSNGNSHISFNPAYHGGIQQDAKMHATLVAENVSLLGIRDWARHLGLGSFGAFRIRGDEQKPIVSGISWDLTAPSYIRPLVNFYNGKIKPGFIVADIILNHTIEADVIEAFIRKYDLASSSLNAAPMIAFFVADMFSNDGLALAKQKGILPVTTENLFGSELASALRNLIQLLTDTGQIVSTRPNELERVLEQLTRIEGAANNIRGALFELAVAALVKDIEGGFIETGIRLTSSTGQKVEIDVILHTKENYYLIIECKSKIPGSMVSCDEIERWYNNRIPLINEIMGEINPYSSKKRRFEIWSNGHFNANAMKWLNEQQTEFKNFTVGWRDGEALKTYTNKSNNNSIRKIMNEHYFKHPLEKLAFGKSVR